jgi:hypothetical protein
MARRCVRRKRVRVRGQGTAFRCAKYAGRASTRSSSRKGKRRGKRKGACTQFKRVRSKAGGTVKRCVRFKKGRVRGRFKRGHRPLNKGRKCTEFGTVRARVRDSRGRYRIGLKRVCRSYSRSRIITDKRRLLPANASASRAEPKGGGSWLTDSPYLW